jgi:hypothetical protein
MGTSKEKAQQSWAKFLTPDVLRHNLILCSLYLAAYEILKTSVIDHPKSFFSDWSLDGRRLGQDYGKYVSALNPKDQFYASCLWLKQNGALNDDDLAELERIRKHRNAIAHELPSFISNVDYEVDLERLRSVKRLVEKIERWWIREVEISTNPAYDGVEVKDEDITPGTVIALDLIMELAFSNGNRALH